MGVGLKSDSLVEIKESLSELEDLVYAAGGTVVGSFVQALESYNPATLLGTGKVEEIKEHCLEANAQLIVVDHMLSGAQSRNLEQAWEVPVLDRSQLILDIFAQRAQTYEGKLQVELAQMMDQLPRTVGGWLGSLSRLGGGIGTRGPGEKALELDRRVIRNKMKIKKDKLKKVQKNRNQHQSKRKRHNIPSFALIGYTNAGKSTLLNLLTESNVLAQDQLFATLDPVTRKLYLPELGEAVITDTVGFIRKLPTHLIEAFKSTLEESGSADVLIHVIDLSSPQMTQQIQVVEDLVHEFGWSQKPMIHVFNKTDIAPLEKQFKISQHPRVFMSAKNKEGVEDLKELMKNTLLDLSDEYVIYIPNEENHLVFELARESHINSQETSSQGTLIKAQLNKKQLQKWSPYLS